MFLCLFDWDTDFAPSNNYHIVVVPKILYCLSAGNYTDFYMLNGTFHHIRKSLKFYTTLISSDRFLTISPVYLINFDYFEGYELDKGIWYVIMAGNKRLEARHNGFERLCRKIQELNVINGEDTKHHE